MNHITIIGCGLIGGSFAALAKEQGITIHGIGRRETPLHSAQENGIIDTYATKLEASIVESTDAIVIASPISTVIPMIKELNQLTQKSCTIIELSSVKSFLNDPIVSNSHHEIIAAHPMGGSDVQGLDHASADILRNRPMIVFNDNKTINTLFETLSFKLIHCDSYKEHDRWMSHISHGPYLVASLIPGLLANESADYHHQLSKVAAGGFKDTTRVANSPVEWGLDILNGNKNEMLSLIDAITDQLRTLKSTIENSDITNLQEILTNAKATRNTIVND